MTLVLLGGIEIFKDFDAIYGPDCVTSVDNVSITTTNIEDFADPPYPIEFDNLNVNPNFESATSGNLFSMESINDAILYPSQTVTISLLYLCRSILW